MKTLRQRIIEEAKDILAKHGKTLDDVKEYPISNETRAALIELSKKSDLYQRWNQVKFLGLNECYGRRLREK